MTGVGERIMVLLSAKRLCDLVADGESLDHAARRVMDEVEAVRSAAGLIAMDAQGSIVELGNTPFMPTARRTRG
jgi:isoaspartyl peptidase/L-asparaginase-like protein (Ntn-hydrolase superfamily)